VRLPWKIRKLPKAVPATLAIIFFLSAILKLLAFGFLCGGPNPWEGANMGMLPLEIAVAVMLGRPQFREFGALLGGSAMAGAAALLTWAHWTGRDVRGCGCFGPIEMSYGVHMAVIGVLFVLCLLTISGAEEAPAG
jgi:hypothetical protein